MDIVDINVKANDEYNLSLNLYYKTVYCVKSSLELTSKLTILIVVLYTSNHEFLRVFGLPPNDILVTLRSNV